MERPTFELPSALDYLDEIYHPDKKRIPVVFLDYDGTLTPIVEHPDNAILSTAMREAVRRLAEKTTVAVISGRDRENVMNLVNLSEIFYAGSHGFDISGPHGTRIEFEQNKSHLASLTEAAALLEERLKDIPGSQVERKKYAVAIHFRRVAPKSHDRVEQIVDEVHRGFSNLRKTGGKMIHELRPDMDWHKGKAVGWLLKALKISPSQALPIYIGDDLTDEDAFKELYDYGIGILVREENRLTAARYTLDNTDEVRRFLENLHQVI
ncbi:MAG: trehalose-phosphatase [Deltaproteobacteria bacterium]|nr:trehalose-phosphatase [Deltaproteobacteria bacterium]